MEIKVFGPGCAKCAQTESLVKEVVAAKGATGVTVRKVSDLKEIMAAGIMSTPAVVIDGVVKSTGKVPSKEEVASWLDGGSTPILAPVPASGSAPQNGGCCCGGKC